MSAPEVPADGPDLDALRAGGYTLLPLPARSKDPPPKGWVESKEPYPIPAAGNVAIGTRGEVAILISNDDGSTTWATERFGLPHVRSKRGGHWYFRSREGQVNESNRLTPAGLMEIHVGRNAEGKVAGKYALIPPSIHPDGDAANPLYGWVRPLPPLKDLPECPDLRDLFHPGGTHHEELLRQSVGKARDGKDAVTILAELTAWRDAHFPDAHAHPERELRQIAESAFSKFHAERPPDDDAALRRGALSGHAERLAKIVRTKDSIHVTAILIWAAHTHLVPRFTSTWYLGFKGRTGAGKGTAVESCIALTPNGEVLGETTESYLASATHEGKAIGVEELDLLLERNPFIESLFRNGYRRGAYAGFKVPAKDGKGWEQARRSLFGPKVYDTHVGPSGHLLGRTVLVEMEPDDSVDRALDAEWKVEALAPVRSWLQGEARRALDAWPATRFRSLWDAPEFRERVRALAGKNGRDHVIGALMLATCDLMGWAFDREIGTILAGRAMIEEFGVETEALDALRDLSPSPGSETEVLTSDLLARVNETRKKAGISRALTMRTLASALRELGFRKDSPDWYRAKVGPNRDKAVLRPHRVLSLHSPEKPPNAPNAPSTVSDVNGPVGRLGPAPGTVEEDNPNGGVPYLPGEGPP